MPVTIKDSFKAMYDKAAELWQELHTALKEAGSTLDSHEVRAVDCVCWGLEV